MFIRWETEGGPLKLHEDYEPISELGKAKTTELLMKSSRAYTQFMQEGKPNMAMLALPLGTAVTMEAHGGLRSAIYMLELRSTARGTSTAEYQPQAAELLTKLADWMRDFAGKKLTDQLGLTRYTTKEAK